MGNTRITAHFNAPRARVYAALIDAKAIERWRFPDGMTCQVHSFEPRVGGAFRISLTYESPDARGKTSAHTDTYRGHFAELVQDQRVVEVLEFETGDPALRGEMRITYALADRDGGTELTAVHEGLPDAVPLADNELGWRLALRKLAALVER